MVAFGMVARGVTRRQNTTERGGTKKLLVIGGEIAELHESFAIRDIR